jgi:hypothetical protein
LTVRASRASHRGLGRARQGEEVAQLVRRGCAGLREGRLHEISSPLILSAGPAALAQGLDALVGIIQG